jgi:transcriptional regulator with XRE-family HTH domain
MKSGNPQDPLTKIVAENIYRLRKARRLSQEALGDLVDLNKNTINRIEGGKQTLAVSTLFAFAKAFGVPPEELVRAKVSVVSVPALLARYMKSPYAEIDAPITKEEADELASPDVVRVVGAEAGPEVVHQQLLAIRARNKKRDS